MKKSKTNPRTKKESTDDKELVTIGNKQGRAGRVDNATASRRRLQVEQLIISRYTPRQIAEKLKVNYKTILNDIKIIQSEWLQADIPFINRARLARIDAEKLFRAQLRRLFDKLKDEDLSKKELLYVEELIRRVTKDYRDTMMQIDPEEYMKPKIAELIEAERANARFIDEMR